MSERATEVIATQVEGLARLIRDEGPCAWAGRSGGVAQISPATAQDLEALVKDWRRLRTLIEPLARGAAMGGIYVSTFDQPGRLTHVEFDDHAGAGTLHALITEADAIRKERQG